MALVVAVSVSMIGILCALLMAGYYGTVRSINREETLAFGISMEGDLDQLGDPIERNSEYEEDRRRSCVNAEPIYNGL